MKKALYANSQEAEAAFYDAFSKNDLESMMAVWADDDDVYCVHPGAARISGVENVRESWKRVFNSGQTLSFQLRARHEVHGMMIAVQLNRKTEFDALWNWAMTYMHHASPAHPAHGYFSWSMTTNANKASAIGVARMPTQGS